MKKNKGLRLEVEMTMFEDNGDQPFFVGDATGKWDRMVTRVVGLVEYKVADSKKEILRKLRNTAVEYYKDKCMIRDIDAEIAIGKAIKDVLK